jgi:hypothetical protein
MKHPEPPQTNQPKEQAKPPKDDTPATTWQIAVVVAAAIGVGGLGMMLGWTSARRAPAPSVAQAPSLAGVAPVRGLPPKTNSVGGSRDAPAPTGPKWTRTRQSRWASDGSRTISYEIEAENLVSVWMKRVRPVLAVRCLARQTEVFVVTDSAASIELQDDRHTVRVGFDDEPEVTEQWIDSVSHRELFAPDGIALARRIAQADRMRFGFTPFNAAPVVAEFDVRGFSEPLESIAKMCGRGRKPPATQPKTAKR